MSDIGRIEEEVEVVIARAEPSGGSGTGGNAIFRELDDIRRRLDFHRLMLGAILAIAAVCLALLLGMTSRGM